MPEVKIRATVAPDVPQMMAIDHTCQTDYVWQMDVQRDETQTAVLFREIRLPRSVNIAYPRPTLNLSDTWSKRSGMLTALVGDTIIGYARMNDAILTGTAWITDVVITPRYRRQGFASALVLAVQAWTKTRKSNRMLLEMVSKNIPGIRLAQKLGFEFCGYNSSYYDTQDIALFFSRSIG
jgi:GNAT superfamily N-acetyltransferase